MNEHPVICIAGAGTLGTALGHILAARPGLDVTLLSIEESVVEDINLRHINSTYFPMIRLAPALKATTDSSILEKADILFVAIPSVAVVSYIHGVKNLLRPGVLIVNLAKGFGKDNKTIVENLLEATGCAVCTMKGPTFARELINHIPTAMTVGAADEAIYHRVNRIFSETTIYTDFSTDIKGVETLSILKNIYAILIGIVDAHFDSPNLRFLAFTKAFDEMRRVLLYYGGREETLFKYCGIGDFGLTALNDLSRNRTLGLLIGKGYFTSGISDKVVLEGKISVNIFVKELQRLGMPEKDYFLMNELNKVFNGSYKISLFVSRLLDHSYPE
ncbi:MAG: hypothetical protein M9926_10200 [Lentimicrobium sp.]|uniref:NAD(P)H-dependent glycerol-3-phosphate dehydrogenase n=3 Tax=Lentimicrobium sp. TaxID=2034841 RepID=UPI0025E6F590|nr:NAD(P)H-dependent glycerol-3-phosphate dehydrogenase [Lentimicrobium sp.]MCO5257119.1 hypothetical protein [Lentimicrobium sp.]